MFLMSVTLDVSQSLSGWLKCLAPTNMLVILVTDDTSHEPISGLQSICSAIISLMSVILLVTQFRMWPYWLSAASSSVHHISIASL